MHYYKSVVVSNTTLGVLMASIDINIVPIALPAIFRGINIDEASAATKGPEER
jgi:hypothetical protein